jgi:hypothetical protein
MRVRNKRGLLNMLLSKLLFYLDFDLKKIILNYNYLYKIVKKCV